MSSFRRKISSRANAALSTGPRTPAGKRRSSQNALRHGCRSRRLVIPDPEARQDFDNLLQHYLSRVQPRNPLERASVDQMVAAQWRMCSLRAIETRMLAEAVASQPPGLQDQDALTRTADAFLSLLRVPGFAVLSRYETTQDLNFYRALRNLLDQRRRPPADGKRDGENKICTNKATLGFPYAPGAPAKPSSTQLPHPATDEVRKSATTPADNYSKVRASSAIRGRVSARDS